MSYGQDQRHFMSMAGQSIYERNDEQARRYAHHLAEEAKEFQMALAEGDMVKALDGAVDVIVVALGWMISQGIDPDQAWAAVHDANLSKVDNRFGPICWRNDGQIGKPPGWTGPEAALKTLIEAA